MTRVSRCRTVIKPDRFVVRLTLCLGCFSDTGCIALVLRTHPWNLI